MASFGSTVIAPAQSGAVNIDGLTGAGGNLSQSAGTLNVGTGGMVLSGLTQSGGTLTNTGSTTSDSFNQSGGSFSGTGAMTAASLVQTGGAMTLGGDLSVTQNFSQGASGSVFVGGNTFTPDAPATANDTAARDVSSQLLANNPTPPVLGTNLSNTNMPQPLMVSATTQT